MGLPGTNGAGSDPLRGSIQAPAITLTGCAPSQTGVARMMSRVKGVDGVTRVSLSKSEASNSAGAATASSAELPCGNDDPATFSMVVFFERAASLAEYAPADTGSSGVPVPNAVNQAAGTADPATAPTGEATQGTAPADGTEAQPQAGTSSPTSVTTSTTPGGTP
jgi:hypothetical protein